MQTILVPTDFSQQARNATNHAAELAKAFNARIVLFHAYMLPTPVSEVPYVMVTVDELQVENENQIKAEAEKLNAQFGIEVEWLVRIGIPSDEIRAIAEERTIDLVVMGMKGVGGLDKIIGSTTTNSISKIKVLVLIIPQDSRYQEIRSIAFATDLQSEMREGSIRTLSLIAGKFNSKVQVVHVKKPNHEVDVDKSDWEARLQRVFGGGAIDLTIVEDSNVQHGINDFIERTDSQILVMIAHKHSFFERLFGKSQTKSMAYETRIPLLILHND